MTEREILENANAEEVAAAIGVPMRPRGRNTYIICPGHRKHMGREDSNFGSCILTEHGYHCFAAKESANLAQLVMEQSEKDGKELSFPQAIRFIADVCNLEYTPKQSDTKPFPLTNQELKLLGYKKRKIKMTEKMYDFTATQAINGTYYTSIQPSQLVNCPDIYSLNKLFLNDEEQFWTIIEGNVKNQIVKTQSVIMRIKHDPSILLKNHWNNQNDPFLLMSTLELYLDELQNLLQKIDNKKKWRTNHVSNS